MASPIRKAEKTAPHPPTAAVRPEHFEVHAYSEQFSKDPTISPFAEYGRGPPASEIAKKREKEHEAVEDHRLEPKSFWHNSDKKHNKHHHVHGHLRA
ncbi:hypothetical protein HK104_000674 [Borealophlyctis nickersoniae]|nr:hypothetical protein HK104_000674 [Borealophlyctis nickersoniae]